MERGSILLSSFLLNPFLPFLSYSSSNWKGQAFPALEQPGLWPYCHVRRTIFSTVLRKSMIQNSRREMTPALDVLE